MEQEVLFRYKADSSGLDAASTKAKSGIKGLGEESAKAGQAGTQSFDKMGGAIGTVKSIVAALGITLGAVGIVNFLKDSIQASQQLQTSFLGLGAVAGNLGINMDAAKAAAIGMTRDGFIGMSDASKGLQNLLASGLSLPLATELMNKNKDAAIFNRQSHLGLSESIRVFTEGFKNEISTLTDATGVSTNYSRALTDIFKQVKAGTLDFDKYRGLLNDSEIAQIKHSVAMVSSSDQLDNQSKHLVAAIGFLKELTLYEGNAEKGAEQFQVKMSKLSNEILITKAAIGDALIPIITGLIPILQSTSGHLKNAAGEFAQHPLINKYTIAIGTMVAVMNVGLITSFAGSIGMVSKGIIGFFTLFGAGGLAAMTNFWLLVDKIKFAFVAWGPLLAIVAAGFAAWKITALVNNLRDLHSSTEQLRETESSLSGTTERMAEILRNKYNVEIKQAGRSITDWSKEVHASFRAHMTADPAWQKLRQSAIDQSDAVKAAEAATKAKGLADEAAKAAAVAHSEAVDKLVKSTKDILNPSAEWEGKLKDLYARGFSVTQMTAAYGEEISKANEKTIAAGGAVGKLAREQGELYRAAQLSKTMTTEGAAAYERFNAALKSGEVPPRALASMSALLPDINREVKFLAGGWDILNEKIQRSEADNVIEALNKRGKDVIDTFGKLGVQTMPKLDEAVGRNLELSERWSESWKTQISTIVTDLGKGVADAIIKWKGFGSSMIDIAKEFLSAILRMFLEGLFKPVMAGISSLLSGGGFGKGLSSMGGLLGGIGGLFGGGGAAGGGGGIGGIARGPGGAAGGIGGLLGSWGGALGGGTGPLAAGAGGIPGATGILGGLHAAFAAIPVWGWVAAAGLTAALTFWKVFSKSVSEKAANEGIRDFQVRIDESTFKGFIGGLGLSEKMAEGIRKDLISSPKFLQDILLPAAQAQGKVEELISSFSRLEAFGKTWDLAEPLRKAIETGDFDEFNSKWSEIFANSKELQRVLPGWEISLMAVSTGTDKAAIAAEEWLAALTKLRGLPDEVSAEAMRLADGIGTLTDAGATNEEIWEIMGPQLRDIAAAIKKFGLELPESIAEIIAFGDAAEEASRETNYWQAALEKLRGIPDEVAGEAKRLANGIGILTEAGATNMEIWEIMGPRILNIAEETRRLGIELPEPIRLLLDWAEANGLVITSNEGVISSTGGVITSARDLTEGTGYLSGSMRGLIQSGMALEEEVNNLGTDLLRTHDIGEAQRIMWSLLGDDVIQMANRYIKAGEPMPGFIRHMLDWAEANGLVTISSSGVIRASDGLTDSVRRQKDVIDSMKDSYDKLFPSTEASTQSFLDWNAGIAALVAGGMTAGQTIQLFGDDIISWADKMRAGKVPMEAWVLQAEQMVIKSRDTATIIGDMDSRLRDFSNNKWSDKTTLEFATFFGHLDEMHNKGTSVDDLVEVFGDDILLWADKLRRSGQEVPAWLTQVEHIVSSAGLAKEAIRQLAQATQTGISGAQGTALGAQAIVSTVTAYGTYLAEHWKQIYGEGAGAPNLDAIKRSAALQFGSQLASVYKASIVSGLPGNADVRAMLDWIRQNMPDFYNTLGLETATLPSGRTVPFGYPFPRGYDQEGNAYYQIGGYVPRTGFALVHKGETVMKAGQIPVSNNYSSSPTVVVNITGDNYGIDDLDRKIAESVTRNYRRGGFNYMNEDRSR